jgi:predicted metal-dependent hydrolase
MTVHEICYGDQTIPFELIRSDRKTLETRVKPDGSVEVRAPSDLDLDRIMEIVTKRGRWILSKKIHFLQYPRERTTLKFVSGETHRYLGKQYRLKVIRDTQTCVKLKGRFIEVRTPSTSPEIIEILLYNWYRDRAENRFQKVLDDAMKVFGKYGIKRPEMNIKRMKRRWGSCIHDKNRINLNLELIRTSTYCIEYVIYHELAHLKIPNHQKEYYRLIDTLLPDWKERKRTLERTSLL